MTSTSGRNSTYGYTNGLLSALKHVQSGVTLTDMAYDYGPDGQLKAILDRVDPAKSRFISYDALNRLVQVSKGVPPASGGVPVPVEDYAYDEEGNRTSSHLSATYSSNDHNQLLEDANYTYGYDVKGNRTTRKRKSDGRVETYTYDSQNRLVGYTDGTTKASYAYDALGRRIGKVVNKRKVAFIRDMAVFSKAPLKTPLFSADLGFDDVVMEFELTSIPLLRRRILHTPNIDEPISFELYSNSSGVGSGRMVDLFSDHQFNIRAAIENGKGSILAMYSFDSFGNPVAEIKEIELAYLFVGRWYDAESGLYFNRARAYDPIAGRFLQTDPIEFNSNSLNIYSYVSNDPYNMTDPEGLAAIGKRSMMGSSLNIIAVAGTRMATKAVSGIGGASVNLAASTAAVFSSLFVLKKDVPKAAETGRGSGGEDGKKECLEKYLECNESAMLRTLAGNHFKTGHCSSCYDKCIVDGVWPYGIVSATRGYMQCH